MEVTQQGHCSGLNCDWAIDQTTGQGLCLSGAGTCLVGDFLEAGLSDFHDKNLMAATQQIKQILAAIPEAEDGRQLSFFVMDKGILLAWAHHDKDVPADAVTAKDDSATIAEALKLKNL